MTEGLYVHIPYCKRRCAYCGLPSTEGRQRELESYLHSLAKEAEQRCSGRLFDTVFVGGGTPSILSPEQLESLFTEVLAQAQLSENAEVSIEVNPDTVTKEWVSLLPGLPINRVSVGVQSFVEEECKHLGRLHNPTQAKEAFSLLRQAGVDNISLDLIAGFPNHNMKNWQRSLDRACSLEPEHLSLYLYHREEETLFDDELAARRLSEVDEDVQAEMYYKAKEVLQARGYEHYEISNFARPGKSCRHNINYWIAGQYCGLGAGAASHEGNVRFSNVIDPAEYVELIEAGKSPVGESEDLPLAKKWRESMMLRLRLLSPTELEKVLPLPDEDTIEDVRKTLSEFAQEGFVEEHGSAFVLSARALTVANEILAKVV